MFAVCCVEAERVRLYLCPVPVPFVINPSGFPLIVCPVPLSAMLVSGAGVIRRSVLTGP